LNQILDLSATWIYPGEKIIQAGERSLFDDALLRLMRETINLGQAPYKALPALEDIGQKNAERYG